MLNKEGVVGECEFDTSCICLFYVHYPKCALVTNDNHVSYFIKIDNHASKFAILLRNILKPQNI